MRLLRVAGSVLAAGLALAGCGDAAVSGPAPTPGPSASAVTSAAAPAGPLISGVAASAGSDGLTVRYTDSEGLPRTLRVEDFPR